MMFKQSSIILSLSVLLYSSTALANVDITDKDKIEVSSWSDLKSAVENSSNAGKVIVLKADITADANNPIKSVGGAGIIIDGDNHTITGADGDSQFLSFASKKSDLIIQNITLNGFAGIPDKYIKGNAIYNDKNSTVGDISANFTNNISTDNYSDGGAIYNVGIIGNITGDFTNNSTEGNGGAIYNQGTLGNITGDFNNNNASSGSAIYNNNKGTIGNITGDFNNNTGNAIHNYWGG